jgi:excinuclease ABC subunit C
VSDLAEKIHNLPSLPGVYVFKGERGDVLYVGKAKSLSQRVRNYLGPDLIDPRLRELMDRARDVDTIATATEVEALLLEASLIRQHRPHYNILLKDDKSFPYVRLSVQEEVPRLSVTRSVRNDGARYLGPYTDVKNLRRTLRELRRVFPVRTCSNFEEHRRTNRPCLYFHIRRCVGPCTTRSRVDAQEYRALVDSLILFLTGRDSDLLRRLREQMSEAADRREFERAARLRDQISVLETARTPQSIVLRNTRDTDVLGVARHARHAAVATLVVRGGRVIGKECRILERIDGVDDATLLQQVLVQQYLHRTGLPRRLVLGVPPADAEVTREALRQRAGRDVSIVVPRRGFGRRLLATAERNAALALEDLEARRAGRRARFSPDVLELQRALELDTPPYRMICFDISNLGADHAVAAIVASEGGRPKKSLYRRMRLRRPGPDDFAMIGEAVERYWARVESDELPRPDLVVIDGGIGQLRAAGAALETASTERVPLIALAKREEEIVREARPALRLPRRSRALRALQRLRDEAHRFGLAYHRTLRGRARVVSALDAVAGVGPSRRAALLRAFGSVAALALADAAEIVRRAGVPASVAARVHAALAPAGGEGAESPRRVANGEGGG